MADDTKPVAAAGSVLAGMLLIGLIDTLVIYIAALGGLWQFHLLRALMALPLIWLAARATGARLRPTRPAAVAQRSLLLALSMLLYFGALAFVSVSEAAAGLFTAPIFVLLLSVFVFGERVGWRRITAVAAGFAGVVLVLRPEGGAASLAVAMPVAAAIFYALAVLTTRRSCRGEGTLALLAGFYVVIAVLGALGCAVLAVWQPSAPAGPEGFLLRGWQAPGPAFLGWTAAQAVGSVLGVGLLTRAYRLGEASFVAAFEYTLLIFAAGWGYLLHGQVLGGSAWAGIVLIVASGAILALRRR